MRYAIAIGLVLGLVATAHAGLRCIKPTLPPPHEDDPTVEFQTDDADVHTSGLWHRLRGTAVREGTLDAGAHRTLTALRTSGASPRRVVACLDALIADPKHARACELDKPAK